MAKLLLLETATNICSVGISQDGQLLVEKTASEDYSHAKVITLLIEACLQATNLTLQEIDAVAVSSGPGSFTSLRVGTATAKGICYALNKPLIVVDTLKSLARATLAQASIENFILAPAIDARRQEVYIALYNSDLKSILDTTAMIIDDSSFQHYRDQGIMLLAAGNGAAKICDILNGHFVADTGVLSQATHLAFAAEQAFQSQNFSDIAYYEPLYLKPPNITKSKKKL